MPERGNLYSQFVAGAKVVLPLVALGLLSTLFLFGRDRLDETDIPFAEIEAIAREPRMSEPRYSGTTEDGGTVAIAADMMRPLADRPDSFVIETIRAEFGATDGSEVVVAAGEGEVDGRDRTARFGGLVRLSSSTGYEMETAALRADLATGRLVTDGPLEVQAPYGELTAGALTVTGATEDQPARLDFTDGVRLLYRPQDAAGAPNP